MSGPSGAVLDDDPRWQRLLAHWRSRYGGLMALGKPQPTQWLGPSEPLRNPPLAILQNVPNILTEDFCILDGEHHFVRCEIPLPVIGSDKEVLSVGGRNHRK